MEILEWAYTDNYETLDEWIDLIKNDGDVYPKFRIPYQEWVDEYIKDIENRSESEVIELLRYLLFPFTRYNDISSYEAMKIFSENINTSGGNERIKDSFNNIEMYRRIENQQDAWEGLTWVLQLLPFKPYKAIKALNSYLYAEVAYMPDDRIIGINQCIAIIEAKYINTNKGMEKYILELKPREFELLIGNLYKSIGYETEITPATRDGGKDIIARINREDGKDIVYAECKLYKTTELTKETVRAFAFTVIKDNVNRGVLFCTGYVNEQLKEIDSRIQIWTLEDIIILLNSHLGSNWYKRISMFIHN